MRREGLLLIAPLAVAFIVFAWFNPKDDRPAPNVVIAPTTSTTVLGVLCTDANGMHVRTDRVSAARLNLVCEEPAR